MAENDARSLKTGNYFQKKSMLEFAGNDSLWKVLSAIFYGISSFSIMIINKSVLTSYHFPSFQALSIGAAKFCIIYSFEK